MPSVTIRLREVDTDAKLGGDLSVSGATNIEGDSVIDGTLSVGGNASFAGDTQASNLDVSGTLSVGGETIISGHIIPDSNNAYDVGSPEFKIRDMFVSDESLWIGDTTKISNVDGQIRFRKRKTGVVPRAILNAGASAGHLNEGVTTAAALAHAGLNDLNDMKMQHWFKYMRTLDNKAKMTDIFRNDNEDYDESSAVTNVAASRLENARKINGVDFDGTQDITIPTGNADTATLADAAIKLQTPRKINSVDFDGTQDITIPTGNANTATLADTAIKLQTPRKINGVDFDGTLDITIEASGGGGGGGYGPDSDILTCTNDILIERYQYVNVYHEQRDGFSLSSGFYAFKIHFPDATHAGWNPGTNFSYQGFVIIENGNPNSSYTGMNRYSYITWHPGTGIKSGTDLSFRVGVDENGFQYISMVHRSLTLSEPTQVKCSLKKIVNWDGNSGETGDGSGAGSGAESGAGAAAGSGAGLDGLTSVDGNIGIGTSPQTKLHVLNSVDSTGTGDAFISGLTANPDDRKPSECLRLQGQWRSPGSGALLRFTNTHGAGTNPNSGEYNLAGIAGIDYDNQWGGALCFYTSAGAQNGGNDLETRMLIDNAGNVGIGISRPNERLHVNGDIRLGGEYGVDENKQYNIRSAGQISIHAAHDGAPDDTHICLDLEAGRAGSNKSQIRICGANASTSFQKIMFEVADQERMRISHNGNVGIGTSSPGKKLEIGHGYQSLGAYLDTYRVSGVVGGTVIGTRQGGGTYKNGIYITDSANVGIGTNNPHCPLHVVGYGGSVSDSGTYHRGFRYDIDNVKYWPGGHENVGIYAQDDIMSGGYILSQTGTFSASDERIKKDVMDVVDGDALRVLRKLQPKQYKYIDKHNNPQDTVWGFIAQEVRDTLPHSTQTRRDVIPNIDEMATVSDSGKLVFNEFDTANLNAGDKVRVYDKHSKPTDVVISAIIDARTVAAETEGGGDLSTMTYSFDEDGNVGDGKQVYVYGQHVNDFVYLKKDAIWTVATAALQEVDRQLQDTKTQLEEEKAKTASLMERLAAVESKLLSL